MCEYHCTSQPALPEVARTRSLRSPNEYLAGMISSRLRTVRALMRATRWPLYQLLFWLTYSILGAGASASSVPLKPTLAPDSYIYVRSLERRGFIFTRAPIPRDADGRPKLTFANRIPPSEFAYLTLPFRSAILKTVASVKPQYRSRVAFFFQPSRDGAFLAVFLNGDTRFPVLNLCYRDIATECRRYCPYFVDPIRREVIPNTMESCADRAPIWSAPPSD